MTFPLELIARIAAAAALAGVIGFERDRHGRSAGLRTHMLVGLASATYMVVSLHLLDRSAGVPAGAAEHTDLAHVASSIVTGIGFLGGGAIFRSGIAVQGLTTAAGLWMVGAIGMACGAGQYGIAAAATALGLVILGLLRAIEARTSDRTSLRLVLALAPSAGTAEVEQRLRDLGASIERRAIRHEVAEGFLELEYEVRMPADSDSARIPAQLSDLGGLRYVRCEATK